MKPTSSSITKIYHLIINGGLTMQTIDEFEKTVCESKEFQNLINHTFEHQVKSGNNSKEEIRKRYIDLVRELYSIAESLDSADKL